MPHRHRRPANRVGVVLAVLALFLRIAWPTPIPAAIPSDIGGLAALGEHAMCLAAPASTDQAPVPHDKLPAPTGDHADHDHSLCCLWHASAGVALPQIAASVRILFAQEMRPFSAVPADFRPASLSGPSRARGPPQEA
jgi:hypothetical protein